MEAAVAEEAVVQVEAVGVVKVAGEEVEAVVLGEEARAGVAMVGGVLEAGRRGVAASVVVARMVEEV